MRPTHCEVCTAPLALRGNAKTGVCMDCRRAGAAFARGWAEDLMTGGLTAKEAAVVIGTTPQTVRARRREAALIERRAA
jgi:hypothetical protein